MTEWLEGARLRPSTLESYRRNLELHVFPAIGRLKLKDLRETHLDKLYRELERSGRTGGEGKGLSLRTTRYIHTIIRRALRDAVRHKMIPPNVAVEADPPTSKQAEAASPEPATWSGSEMARFVAFTQDDRYGIAWALIASTGMRRGEALGLRWSDLDLEGKPPTARVERSANAIRHVRQLGPTKTDENRVVELDAETVSRLKAWKARQSEERLVADDWDTSEDDLVLTLPTGFGYDPDRFSREFLRKQNTYNRLNPKTPLPRLSVHGLRHSHGTDLDDKGVSPRVIQERLGHSSVVTTLNMYVIPRRAGKPQPPSYSPAISTAAKSPLRVRW